MERDEWEIMQGGRGVGSGDDSQIPRLSGDSSSPLNGNVSKRLACRQCGMCFWDNTQKVNTDTRGDKAGLCSLVCRDGQKNSQTHALYVSESKNTSGGRGRTLDDRLVSTIQCGCSDVFNSSRCLQNATVEGFFWHKLKKNTAYIRTETPAQYPRRESHTSAVFMLLLLASCVACNLSSLSFPSISLIYTRTLTHKTEFKLSNGGLVTTPVAACLSHRK